MRAKLFALAAAALALCGAVSGDDATISGQTWDWSHVQQWTIDPAGNGTYLYDERIGPARNRVIALKQFTVGRAGYLTIKAVMAPFDQAARDKFSCTPFMTDGAGGYGSGSVDGRRYRINISVLCNGTMATSTGTDGKPVTTFTGDPRSRLLEEALDRAHDLVMAWTAQVPVFKRLPADSVEAKRLIER